MPTRSFRATFRSSAYNENPDGEEIIADIEARIAELILSTQDNGRTVALPLVKNIIAQLGSAAEIEEESSTSEEPKEEFTKSSDGEDDGSSDAKKNPFDYSPENNGGENPFDYNRPDDKK